MAKRRGSGKLGRASRACKCQKHIGRRKCGKRARKACMKAYFRNH